jgi:hypothetical protein
MAYDRLKQIFVGAGAAVLAGCAGTAVAQAHQRARLIVLRPLGAISPGT